MHGRGGRKGERPVRSTSNDTAGIALDLARINAALANNIHISYDLKEPNGNYSAVIAKIKELGSWAKINDSFWYVDSTFTATQARDHIVVALNGNDSLFVVNASDGQAAWHGLSTNVSSFLRENWPK
jgi:hypothetical protein